MVALFLSVCAEASCDDLRRLHLANTTLDARIVEAGQFRLPPGGRRPSIEFFTAFDRLPPFCRVQAVLTPSPDSHIEVEVWLPASGWNGKYLGVGNGGFGGSFNYFRLGDAINNGYAVASTDTGHKGSDRDSQWAAGHPEKQTDFDYRSIHEMTVMAKSLIRAFYGKPPEHSYFHSCSNGGRQALMEAQRYPADYDGVMAGAPALHWGFKTFVSDRLEAFRNRGGKLVIYQGGADNPKPIIAYYKRVVARMGEKRVERFMQLYVIDGMGHCGSGPVPNDFGEWLTPVTDVHHSLFKALERWVENGIPPHNVIATQYKTDGDRASGVLRTRPLCRFTTSGARCSGPDE
ncbi:MAG TPA: tannase/feruloyl esterase family alpha/beta hydrolase [Thermoanaerobaculia bacterium]|nr:tannase/feruloyl esterase family alpha/beta hydrolase [Thermoanaerobaculia bacterium]